MPPLFNCGGGYDCRRVFGHEPTIPAPEEWAHGQLVELYAALLVKNELASHGTWRCLNLVGDLLSWIKRRGLKLTDVNEHVTERYLKYRAGKHCIQPGDRAALKRLLSVLREAGMIAPAALPPTSPQDQIFGGSPTICEGNVGLAPRTIVHHLPFVRRFLHDVCPAGASDLGKISYIERHAWDRSAASGKTMCWSLRAFLRYLHYQGLTRLALADCVPSIWRWKLTNLPTYLSAA